MCFQAYKTKIMSRELSDLQDASGSSMQGDGLKHGQLRGLFCNAGKTIKRCSEYMQQLHRVFDRAFVFVQCSRLRVCDFSFRVQEDGSDWNLVGTTLKR